MLVALRVADVEFVCICIYYQKFDIDYYKPSFYYFLQLAVMKNRRYALKQLVYPIVGCLSLLLASRSFNVNLTRRKVLEETPERRKSRLRFVMDI
jgi:hypothetical protein